MVSGYTQLTYMPPHNEVTWTAAYKIHKIAMFKSDSLTLQLNHHYHHHYYHHHPSNSSPHHQHHPHHHDHEPASLT